MRGWFINRSTGSAFKIMIMTAIIKIPLSFKTLPFLILLILHQSFGLTTDGIRLLSFKYSVLSDPLGVLDSWSYTDDTPCSWHGVVCENRCVTGLSLPSSSLTVTIPANLGSIPHLREVNLSNNSISGSIPLSLYNAPELETLDLSNNLMSGEFEFVGGWRSLRYLNMSGNSLTGKLPQNLAALKNLTVVSLTGNRISGDLPSGFESVEVLDLSGNSINGSLPEKFGSGELVYFNISHNNISGEIPKEFANKVPITATIDLSFNKLRGPIPESDILINQDEESFVGNPELCGKPLKNLCETSSTSGPPNSTTFTPAIAGIPQTFPSTPSHSSSSTTKSRFKTSTIIGIIVGDIAIVAVLALIFIYLVKKRRGTRAPSNHQQDDAKGPTSNYDWGSPEEEHKWLRSWACLLKRRHTEGEEEEEEESNQNSSSENSDTEIGPPETSKPEINPASKEIEKKGLVTVDGGENELELETLLKASAYILGTTGSSIIYKAVLEDGTMLAVRRIGENGLDRFKDFENQVRVIAKLVHPNLVRIRGFYWAADEKLVIYDYVPHGSLANARYKKVGSSPSPLPWEVRLKIAKGTARGLLYIHDKKQVHGNLKPSNILLESDMEPKIGDFGLERLLASDQSCKVGESRNFGSKRSNTSRESFPDIIMGSNPSPSPSSMGCISPYYAPESLRNLKPNPKWDVYSYGVVLLELLTGRVIISDEFGPASMTWSSTLTVQDKKKVLRMVDTAIYADLEGKEGALLALLRLAYGCISPIPQKRPHMKEMVNALEKFPSTSFLYY